MKTKKIPKPEAESRPLYVKNVISEFGRSRGTATCPFCGRDNIVYLWSLSGGGKRCQNHDCRAFLAYGAAYRDIIPVGGAE